MSCCNCCTRVNLTSQLLLTRGRHAVRHENKSEHRTELTPSHLVWSWTRPFATSRGSQQEGTKGLASFTGCDRHSPVTTETSANKKAGCSIVPTIKLHFDLRLYILWENYHLNWWCHYIQCLPYTLISRRFKPPNIFYIYRQWVIKKGI